AAEGISAPPILRAMPSRKSRREIWRSMPKFFSSLIGSEGVDFTRAFYPIVAFCHPALKLAYSESRMAARKNSTTETLRVGLCINCKHMRRLLSERGSTFYMCERGLREPSFAKYPRLPVEECRGYEELIREGTLQIPSPSRPE